MYKNSYQGKVVTILFSLGSKPLNTWKCHIRNGHVKRITDDVLKSLVLEVCGTNVASAFISCPPGPRERLSIRLPFVVLIVKNLNKYFTFEVQILDDHGFLRRFRASNYNRQTKVKEFITTLPMTLDEGWNQIQFNLADFTKRAYGTNYVEAVRVTLHANCRVRRVFFSDRLYSLDELPREYRLLLPMPRHSTAADDSIIVK